MGTVISFAMLQRTYVYVCECLWIDTERQGESVVKGMIPIPYFRDTA